MKYKIDDLATPPQRVLAGGEVIAPPAVAPVSAVSAALNSSQSDCIETSCSKAFKNRSSYWGWGVIS